MIWRSIAEEQAGIIDSLTVLCHQLIERLSQYQSIDEEEKRLSEIRQEYTNGAEDICRQK